MLAWMVNRDFQEAGLIKEAILELDDLVIASNRDELVRIFGEVMPSQFPNLDLDSLKNDFTGKELASWAWYCLKRVDDPWVHIVRSGTYTYIFK